MTTWFTADSHFGHANIIRYCGRPFDFKEEHDRVLEENWNSLVNKQDIVYHLGDFGFGSPEYLRKIADRLHGKICLLKGNHDKHCNKEVFNKRFVWIKDYHLMQQGNQKIVLMHYAMRTWHFSNHGSWHLFGHSHSNLPPHGLSFDVGVDNIAKLFGAYRPISFNEVQEVMAGLKLQLDYNPENKKESSDTNRHEPSDDLDTNESDRKQCKE